MRSEILDRARIFDAGPDAFGTDFINKFCNNAATLSMTTFGTTTLRKMTLDAECCNFAQNAQCRGVLCISTRKRQFYGSFLFQVKCSGPHEQKDEALKMESFLKRHHNSVAPTGSDVSVRLLAAKLRARIILSTCHFISTQEMYIIRARNLAQ
jgi:hypothetical protein